MVAIFARDCSNVVGGIYRHVDDRRLFEYEKFASMCHARHHMDCFHGVHGIDDIFAGLPSEDLRHACYVVCEHPIASLCTGVNLVVDPELVPSRHARGTGLLVCCDQNIQH